MIYYPLVTFISKLLLYAIIHYKWHHWDRQHNHIGMNIASLTRQDGRRYRLPFARIVRLCKMNHFISYKLYTIVQRIYVSGVIYVYHIHHCVKNIIYRITRTNITNKRSAAAVNFRSFISRIFFILMWRSKLFFILSLLHLIPPLSKMHIKSPHHYLSHIVIL